jgi:pyruvate formate lyase activating enzyme
MAAPAGGFGAALARPAWSHLLQANAAGSGKDALEELIRTAPKARYWVSTSDADCRTCHDSKERLTENPHKNEAPIVRCLLCAQSCVIRAGQRGRCRARMNIKGELRSLVYGRPVSVHVDPIEKKPFYHYLPGSAAFSLATIGCPLSCKFCQNWEISQAQPEDYPSRYVSPADVAGSAVARSAPVIAFTYNEPTVFTEYLTDIARSARRHGLRCVLISCGFMNAEPLKEMFDVLDAIKIDLKGYDESFYRSVCSAELRPVLRSLKQIAASRKHLEIVNLVVPTLNDSDRMLKALAEWVAGELGPDVPVHFTRFHPDYQLLNLPPTPVSTLERARDLAMAQGIRYAFVGNVPDHPGNHTYCPSCGKVVLRRSAIFLVENNLKGGRCKYCGTTIAGTWS